jgi:hypothetical protein
MCCVEVLERRCVFVVVLNREAVVIIYLTT